MTILAFWAVGSDEVDRHTLEGMFDLEAFDILWHKRDELNARFYNPDTRDYSDQIDQRGIKNASDFEDDYNDRRLVWKLTKVLVLDEDYVKQIINE